jgi:tRNA-Thr(GGU) m(6)t(6)A37 methyltransferase TsaA
VNSGIEVIPVGVVHSPVRKRADMPLQGIRGEVEIFAAYSEALEGIESNSHLILLCWMHHGIRDILKARARKVSPDLPEKGVFALRSPSRPNPVSFSVVRLVERRDSGILDVDFLDIIDGTPVIDIKPYQPGWDAVFSATTHDRSEKILKMGPARYRDTLIREAVNYHGEWCSGTAMAVRIAEKATELLRGDLRRTGISINLGTSPCLADGLIGITGARPGNGRLIFTRRQSTRPPADRVEFLTSIRACRFRIEPVGLLPETVLAASEDELFSLRLRAR